MSLTDKMMEASSRAAGLAAPIGLVDKMHESFRKGYSYPSSGTRVIDDPTFLGFTLLFHFDDSRLFAGYNQVNFDGTLKGDLPTTECAFSYLNSIGDTTRMAYLKTFIEELQYLNTYKAYYWQAIEGLDSIWEASNDFSKLPAASEYEFTIRTIETIDLKIFGLMELLRKACYDYEYSRQVIPTNLQRFNMTVYINEIRTFRPSSYKMGSKGISGNSNLYGNIDLAASLGLSDVYGNLNFQNVMNRIKGNSNKNDGINSSESTDALINWLNKDEHGIVIKFTGCKFLSTSGADFISTVSNNSIEQAANSLKVKAKSAEIVSILAWFEEEITSKNISNNLKDKSLWEKIKNRSKNLLETAAMDAYNKGSRKLRAKASTLIQENLPGGLLGTIQDLKRGNLINALDKILKRNDLGEVYNHELSPQSSREIKDLGNLFTKTDIPIPKVNNLGEAHQEEPIVFIKEPQNLGTLFPDSQNQLIEDRLKKVNNLGEAYPEEPVNFVKTPKNLGEVYSDLQNQ